FVRGRVIALEPLGDLAPVFAAELAGGLVERHLRPVLERLAVGEDLLGGVMETVLVPDPRLPRLPAQGEGAVRAWGEIFLEPAGEVDEGVRSAAPRVLPPRVLAWIVLERGTQVGRQEGVDERETAARHRRSSAHQFRRRLDEVVAGLS